MTIMEEAYQEVEEKLARRGRTNDRQEKHEKKSCTKQTRVKSPLQREEQKPKDSYHNWRSKNTITKIINVK